MKFANTAAVLFLAGLAILGALLASDPEEGEALFNCHIHGDRVCGASAGGVLGFVNL